MADEARRLNGPYLKRLADRAPLRHGQVGDDARRQDRRGLGRQPVDLRAPVEGPGPRSPGPDGRDRRRDRHRPGRRPPAHRPTARSQGPDPGRPRRSARLPTDSRLARTAREVPVLVAVTDRAPADRRTDARSPRLRGPLVPRRGTGAGRAASGGTGPSRGDEPARRRGRARSSARSWTPGRSTRSTSSSPRSSKGARTASPRPEGPAVPRWPRRSGSIATKSAWSNGDVRVRGTIPRAWRCSISLDDPQG